MMGAGFVTTMVMMTTKRSETGPGKTKSPEITDDLVRLAKAADTGSPKSPHRPFVVDLIKRVREATGGFWGVPWYQKLIKAAGVQRSPSTRTFNNTLAALKEGAGEPHGITLKAVNELAKLVVRLETAVEGVAQNAERMAKAQEEIQALMTRQVAMADAIQKRQMIFADQSQVYGRLIEEVTNTVNAAVTKFSKKTDALDGAGLTMTIQANRVAMSVDRLTEAIQRQSERD